MHTGQAADKLKLVFIGGVHGSGKTHLCTLLAPAIGATCYVASALLAEVQKPADAGAKTTLQTTDVPNLSRNQELILQKIEERRHNNERLILDGHFCILTAGGDVEDVPIKYFKALRPTVLLLIDIPIREILVRLQRRGGTSFTDQQLATLVVREKAHAHAVSDAFSVPLKVIRGPDPLNEALTFLNAL
jgi:adenylate kinase